MVEKKNAQGIGNQQDEKEGSHHEQETAKPGGEIHGFDGFLVSHIPEDKVNFCRGFNRIVFDIPIGRRYTEKLQMELSYG
jgi:hypothetical protein